jgi:iron complex outermembrane receptor protein
VSYRPDAISEITGNFEYVKSEQQPDSGLPLQLIPDNSGNLTSVIPSVSRTKSYQTPLDLSDQDMLRIRLDYRRQLSHSLTVRNKFYFTRLDWISNGTILNGAFPDTENFQNYNVFRTFQTLNDVQNLVGNQVEATLSFSTGKVRHNLLGGVEASALMDDWEINLAAPVPEFGINTGLIIDLYNPQETINDIDQLMLSPYTLGNADILQLAPYLVNQTTFSDKFQLFYGGRLNLFDYSDSRTDLDLRTSSTVQSSNSNNYARFSPMAGLVFSPTAELSLYANASNAFAPPSTLSLGAPDPEESRQFEGGIKVKLLNGLLNSSVAVYDLEKKNISIPDNITGAPTQTGNQKSRGVEFELNTQPVIDWQWFFNYAYTDAELTEFREVNLQGTIVDYSGNTAAFVPQHILNCWSTKEFNDTFGAGLGLRYVSSQFTDEDNSFHLDGYLTFDAMVFYKFDNTKFSLNFKNISGKAYETRGGVGSRSVMPADPFAVYGSIGFSL